jgi:hypothetical protein
MEDIGSRFSIEHLAEPVETRCSEPGCTDGHGAASFVLYDHLLRTKVGFSTREDALEHINTLPSVQNA